MAYTFSQGYMRGDGNPNLDLQIKDGGGIIPKIYIDDLTDFMYKFDDTKISGEKWVVLKDDPRPYKVYVALLTQTGTDAPVATVLENTLGGTITFGYDYVGTYSINSAGLFTSNKTFVQTTLGYTWNANIGLLNYAIQDDSLISLLTFDSQTTAPASNDVLTNTSIEIRVYP